MVLLQTSGTARAADSKSVRLHTFDVPAGVEALAFRFDFRPRTCADPAINGPLIEAAIEQHARTRRTPEEQRRNVEAERTEAQPLFRSINNLINAVLIDPQGRWRGRWDRNPSSEEE